MSDAIALRNVTRRFGDLSAVDSLSFQVHPGEVFGLLGPNGAGKTTTLSIITGLLRRHGGEVQVRRYFFSMSLGLVGCLILMESNKIIFFFKVEDELFDEYAVLLRSQCKPV